MKGQNIMKRNTLAVIGVGNMAKAIINGILDSGISLSEIVLFDLNEQQYSSLLDKDNIRAASSVEEAVASADSVLLSVKPQNYAEVLSLIKGAKGYKSKLYISIGAGITTQNVKKALGDISVIRVLPNVPMLIGKGVSVICRNEEVACEDFKFVKEIFASAGSVIEIEEREMNRMIGVTSSSPAYVFKFIDAICEGARAQGLEGDDIVDAVCDVLIGSALMLKCGEDSPAELVSKVASKGGTTERAIAMLDKYKFTEAIIEAMKACTARADELGG